MPRTLEKARTRILPALHELGAATLGRVTPTVHRWTWLRHVPPWPFRARPPAPWPDYPVDTPPALRTVPGVWRDEEAAKRAFAERPLYYFFTLHPEVARLLPRYGWAWQLPSVPRRLRTRLRVAEVSAAAKQPSGSPPKVEPVVLTEDLRAEAKRLGLSKVGFAPFDPKYVYDRAANQATTQFDSKTVYSPAPRSAGAGGAISEGSVIVCVLEQDWGLTQTIPSTRCERGVMRTYSELITRAAALVEYLHERGFEAQLHGPGGALVSIHYAVEAGLGQLGLNGQLLTPETGSRCRITLITTNAKLVHGQPVDYGIHAICDACQLCVKRCPPGAIPKRRSEHRGITKAKIKPERCAPVMAQAHGCAVCMKVCPVQRYGLAAVTKHFVENRGAILGKGTDELEGYGWIDGRHYGPGQKPRINQEFLSPLGVVIDPGRKEPPSKPTASEAEDAETLTMA